METQLFAEATKKFVRQVCPEGDMISNPNIFDSKKLLEPTRLAVKIKTRFKPFQKIKYRVSDYKLEDCFGDLPGDQAEMKTSCFMEKFGFATKNRQQGNVSGDVPHCGGKLEGHNSATLQMTFGQLDVMEFVNFKASRKLVEGRKLQANPELKKNERLVLVKDRIVTTTPTHMECLEAVDVSCRATTKMFPLELQGGGDIYSPKNISMTVPPKTVIAYNVIELNELEDIRTSSKCKMGNQVLMAPLNSDLSSSEETPMRMALTSETMLKGRASLRSVRETIHKPWTCDSMCDIIYEPSINVLCKVLEELQKVKEELQKLSSLEENIRSSLFMELRGVLTDRPTFQRFLEHTLEGWWETGTREESVGTLLDQLPKEPETLSYSPVELLISALQALPDGALNMLASCSTDELHALNSLVARLKTGNSEPLPAKPMPSNLQEDGEYDWATRLFCSPNEVLREEGLLWEDVGIQPGGLLLLLCIAVQGFVCLSG